MVMSAHPQTSHVEHTSAAEQFAAARQTAIPEHRLTVSREHAPEFWDLLELHRRRTGVPGLINTTLSAPGEPTACSPRDAIRTTFSTAVDALVMSRFLVMKDYWLLRSDGD